MIDLKDLRQNPEKYEHACLVKGCNFDVKEFLILDEKYKEAKQLFENLRAKQNQVTKEIPKLSGVEKETKLTEMKSLSSEVKDSEKLVKELEEIWTKQQYLIPNPASDKVPVGKDDSENVEIRKVGSIPNFDFPIRSHMEIGEKLKIIDLERGAKIAGARSYFLIGDGARLKHAIMNYSMDFLYKKGFSLMDCPHIVNYSSMLGTSYFPGGEDQAYHLDDRDPEYYLIGTSEVSVCSFHSNEILDFSQLPIRYAGYSPCYRREAGTYGKDTKGIYRVHQFYKVEQVVICENNEEVSEKIHMELLENSELLMQNLNIPYRVVDVCTGDMGQGQIYKNDIEAWMPSRDSYGETHSCSTFHEFQARRLQIRYRDRDGVVKIAHTLNNTHASSARMLIAILELNQQKDGTVKIPEVLQPYMGGQKYIGL